MPRAMLLAQMASRSNSGMKPVKPNGTNSNLNRTLKDLESAFADWESLSTAKPRAATDSIPAKKAAKKDATPQDEELRKKTKKLLKDLRRQLADLA
jgi:hypothetical protein